MASPPILTPGGTTGWNKEVWERTIEPATYQKMKFIPLIDTGERLLNKLHIRKHARVSASTLGQSDDGENLNSENVIGPEATVTPVGSYVAVEWSENQEAQADYNVDREAASNIEMALAEATDASALTNIQALTVPPLSQGAVDGAMLRKAQGILMGNTNGMHGVDGGNKIYGIFSHTQYPALAAIPEFNQAEIRGDDENPFVKGVWVKGGGAFLVFSTVVAQDANGWHNALFVPSAFVVSWNVKSRIKRQDEGLMNRVVVFNNLGTAIKHNLRAVPLRTTDSQIT
jgi:hypothetical protein